MSVFKSFEPNPFRVNAFSITGVTVAMTRSADIDDEVTGRLHQIQDGLDCSIPLAGGAKHEIHEADLTQNKEILRDSNRRHREELLAPPETKLEELPPVAAFRTLHTLSPKMTDGLLSLEPLAAAELLVMGLPAVPIEQMRWPASDVQPPSPGRVQLPRAAMLVRSKDRHV